MTTEVPRTAGTTSQSAVLLVRCAEGNEAVRKRLKADVVVYEDLKVEPSVARVACSSESRSDFFFTSVVSLHSHSSARPVDPVRIDLPDSLHEILKVGTEFAETREIFPGLWRHSWNLNGEVDRKMLPDLNRNIVGNMVVSLSADNSTNSVSVPVIVYDSHKLETVRTLCFGEIVIGQEKTLPFVVRALDTKPFLLSKLQESISGQFAEIRITGSAQKMATSLELKASITGLRLGYVEGILTLKTEGQTHAPTEISYSANIVPPSSSEDRNE
jgi:hypothetical protein